MSEPTYTLAEARRVMDLRECANFGHSWHVVENFTAGPMRLVCDRCGWAGSVTMGERPGRTKAPPSPKTERGEWYHMWYRLTT